MEKCYNKRRINSFFVNWNNYEKGGELVAVEEIITIKGLWKNYGAKEVLKGIDLHVSRGEIIGYIGPNGAGKSTTVKILLGIETYVKGEVKLFGKEINQNSIEYKRRIGYVPEIAEVYDNLTAYEYLTFIGQLYGMKVEFVDQKAQKLMELFGIGEVYHSRISSYSKGMRQKLLIISSVLHNPDILFLDEPINGLDANSVMIFKEILAQLASSGKTIFYSSHIMDVVEKISSGIILLNDGKVVVDGSFKELQAQNQQGSLEGIFNQLTGFYNHREIGESFVSVVQEVQT